MSASYPFLLDTWYVAARSEDVAAANVSNIIFHRKILGRDVAIFRTADGVANAVEDRCPHRFAPLHLGKVVGDTLQCGYHGLRFDCSGVCVENPHGNGFIPKNAVVETFPMVERYGLLWIWMGDRRNVDPEAIPDLSFLLDVRRSKVAGQHLVNSHYEIINDNLADLTHVQYVHRGYQDSDGFEKKATYVSEQMGATVTGRYFLESVTVSPMWGRILNDNGLVVDRWLEITWHAASNFSLYAGVTMPGAGKENCLGSILSAHLLTPETERSTHYYYAHTRDYNVGDPETDSIVREWQKVGFREQDQSFLEAVDRAMEGKSLQSLGPVLLSTDAGAMRIRRLLAQLIAEESSSRNREVEVSVS